MITKIIELIITKAEIVKNIDTIILSEGASRTPIILEIFENSYLQNFHIIRSAKPDVAIGIGSVLFSMFQNIIKSRKANYLFGIRISVKWKGFKKIAKIIII